MSATLGGIAESRIFSRLPDIVPRQIAGETILVPVRGELARLQQLFVLDEVGEHIWNLIDGARGTESLLSAVVKTFEVDVDTAREDLVEFLSDLEDAGLVVAAGGPSPPAE